jgi:hypothetical protein
MLRKTHNTINYHTICKAVEARILRVEKEDGMISLADLFTKVLTGDRCRALCKHIMYKEHPRSSGYASALLVTFWRGHALQASTYQDFDGDDSG